MATFERAVMRNLECPICYSLLTQPKQLSCGHVFCEACLTQLLSALTDPDSISCPVCREDTDVGDDGVSSLPTSYPVKGIVADIKDTTQHCDNCDNESKAEYFCSDCTHYLCKDCLEIHGKLRKNANHTVVSADDVKQGKVLVKRKVFCQEHNTGEEYECTDVCITCEKFICMRCRMLSCEKANHEVKSAVEYQQSFSSDADSLGTRVETKTQALMNFVEVIDAEKRKVEQHFDKLGCQIDTTYNEAVNTLKADKLALDMKCKAEKDEISNELDKMKIDVERFVNGAVTIHSLVTKSCQTPLEVNTVAIRESLRDRLTELIDEFEVDDTEENESVLEVSRRAAELEFEKNLELSGSKLGEVQYREWKLEDEVAFSSDNTMCCMGATPDGMMAVGCSEGERGIEIYSAEGKLQQRVLKGVTIHGIAFLSDGRCAVRDTGTTNEDILNVSLYTQGWEKVGARFETLSWDVGGLGNLTVDSDDHIYVDYMKAMKIQVFTSAGGRPIKEIACDGYEPSQIFAMKMSKNLVLQDFSNSVRVINETGVEQHTLVKSEDLSVYPALFKDDTIIIAIINKECNRVTIKQYSCELQHMATLLTSHVIQKPVNSDREWYKLREFTSGEIAFCTPDRLYIFSKSVTPVDD